MLATTGAEFAAALFRCMGHQFLAGVLAVAGPAYSAELFKHMGAILSADTLRLATPEFMASLVQAMTPETGKLDTQVTMQYLVVVLSPSPCPGYIIDTFNELN